AAIGEVNTRFGVTGEALEELSSQFIKFAEINGQDVSGSVDSVSKMMAGFGLEAEDAGRILDALNTVGQQTGVDVGQLLQLVLQLCLLPGNEPALGFIVGSQLCVAPFQLRDPFPLSGDDVIVFLPAGLSAIDRFALHREPVFFTDVQEQLPAHAVEGDLPVVLPAGFLLREGQRNPQGFQRLLLLRLDLPIAVFDIEHLPGVNVWAGLVQMQCPVQDVHMAAEALLEDCHEFLHDFQQHLGRRAIALFSDLIDRLLGTDACIRQ
ncbi:MAG: phage tail tape measure protein, partial [Clostridia bacterium]|nr:phage tail tape measure protein [Clostridia bacterium]